MTDREMLEFAARAGGLGPIRGFDYGYQSRPMAVLVDVGARNPYRWSSLSSSGDAMRLAVHLQIALHHFHDSCAAATGARFFTELHNGNPQVAACRAITRAAAEIGKAMP